jgi:hypothetical protein
VVSAADPLRPRPRRDALLSSGRTSRSVGRGGLRPGTEPGGASTEARVKSAPGPRCFGGDPMFLGV